MTWTKLSPVLTLLLLLLQGCGIYSFLGTSLPTEVKTFSLRFQSDATLGPPDLAAKFQQRLSDDLVQRTPLKQVDTNGDLQLEGVIKQFKYVPMAPTTSGQGGKGDQASVDRLTIEVQVDYTNLYDEASTFSTKTFSQYAETVANTSRSNEEPRLIDAIFTKLVEDIFNETVASW
jgi:Lipopolysaccharide-assembly